jgi:glycosyltransferase involved in cell wall biosynthesis
MRRSEVEKNRRFVVINSSHPELDQLAGELAIRGVLRLYIGRYFPSNRSWERALASFRMTRSLYLSGPGRRKLTPGLETAPRIQAGTFMDFASGLPRRLLGQRGERIYRTLQRQRDTAIVRAAQLACRPDDPVIANYSVALEPFQRAQHAGVLRLLNYPIAHHQYTRQLLEEEAALNPEFASDLLSQTPVGKLAERLDNECALASSILVGSTFVRDSFAACGFPPERLYIANYGVDVQDFVVNHDHMRRELFRVAWVGQVTQRKGIKYLLEAWRQFRGPSTELVIAGHFMAPASALGPYRDLYRPVGFLSVAGLRNLFADCDVLVMPSLVEGMSLVVLQAMAAGLPVIVTEHAAGDIVRDGVDGFHVPIRSPQAIVQKLTLMHENPSLRMEMSRNASQRAQHFTWQRFRSQAADFAEALLQDSGAAF